MKKPTSTRKSLFSPSSGCPFSPYASWSLSVRIAGSSLGLPIAHYEQYFVIISCCIANAVQVTLWLSVTNPQCQNDLKVLFIYNFHWVCLCLCLFMCARLCLCFLFGHAMPPHISDQLSERTHVCTTALKELKSKVTQSLSFWVTQLLE